MIQKGFGFLQTQVMDKDEWLTPPDILEKLGPFDLDPCAPINRPWPTAENHFTIEDDGLSQAWFGRVWLNPPYGKFVWTWLDRLSRHRNGIALIFARTGTINFHRQVFEKATGILFLEKHLHFYHVDGIKAKHNSGADSCLVSYDEKNAIDLRDCGLKGKFIRLP